MYEDNLPSPDNLETMALTSEVGCRRAEIVGIHSSIHSVHTVLMSGSLYSLLVYPVKEEQNLNSTLQTVIFTCVDFEISK